MEDGTVRGFRFLRSAGQAPFVLSPLVQSTADFGSLFVPCGYGAKPQRVRAVRIMGPGDREVPYTLDLRLVTALPRFPASSRSALRALECRLQLIAGGDGLRKHPHMIEPDGRGLNAHPPATFRIAAPASAVRVCTRMAHRALESGKSDGYVLALWRSGAPRPAAQTLVTPEAGLGGRESCVEARFDKPAADVELRIGPNGHDHWDWVYITRVDLDE